MAAFGRTLDRPSLQLLMEAIRARRVDVIVIYKIDRLTRSLMDFARPASRARTAPQERLDVLGLRRGLVNACTLGTVVMGEDEVIAELHRGAPSACNYLGDQRGRRLPV